MQVEGQTRCYYDFKHAPSGACRSKEQQWKSHNEA